MKYLVRIFGLVALFLGLSAIPVLADSVQIQYTVTGAFGPDANAAPLSGPLGTYSMSFAIAENPTPAFFDTNPGDFAVSNVPVSYSFQCNGCSQATPFIGTAEDVDFATSALGGLFLVEILADGHDYYWEFWGPQVFTGSVDQPTLLPGGPFVVSDGRFELDGNDFVGVGSATIEATRIATPEPSTLALLLSAFASLGLMAWLKLHRP